MRAPAALDTTGHDVSIAVDVPGVCIVGGCDPVSGEIHTLALIRIQNLGTTTAFLRACGTQPALEEQQFVGGSWVSVGPAISCPFPSTPIPLAAGDSARLNVFYVKGTRRVVMSVGGDASALQRGTRYLGCIRHSVTWGVVRQTVMRTDTFAPTSLRSWAN